MQLAYLVVAHDFPDGVKLLSERLSDGNDQVFVHVDQKSSLKPFASQAPEARFVQPRVSTFWGEFSFVQASLLLLEQALAESQADYFVLLSQMDYPLTTAAYRRAFFQRQAGAEFINIQPVPDPRIGKPEERLSRFKYYPLSRRFRGVDWLFKHLVKMNYQRVLGPMQPYGGSGWWALSREAARYVLSQYRERPELVRYFSFTHIPDELYLHTLLGNSPFYPRCVGNVTYTDWRLGGSGPADIGARHWAPLSAQPVLSDDVFQRREVLFVRKIPQKNYWQTVAELDYLRQGLDCPSKR